VIERQHGGTDMADNLVALCERCHRRRHDGRIGAPGPGVAAPTGRMTAGARGAPRKRLGNQTFTPGACDRGCALQLVHVDQLGVEHQVAHFGHLASNIRCVI
jgi:hypothetical protein